MSIIHIRDLNSDSPVEFHTVKPEMACISRLNDHSNFSDNINKQLILFNGMLNIK